MKFLFGRSKFKLIRFITAVAVVATAVSCEQYSAREKSHAVEFSQSQVAKANSLKILLPLYIYPNWYEPDNYTWSQVVTAAKQVPIVAIINPNNGPDGNPPNEDYARGLEDLKQAEVTTIGYVYTKYGDRPIAEVKRDIDLYYQYFGVQGIFLDESASNVAQIDYYQDIYRYIKAKGDRELVVINPGTHSDREYITRPAADTSVIFENYSHAWGEYQPQAYVDSNHSKHFASLIHSVSDAATMKSYLDKAVERNIGYIYITDDSPNNDDGDPWNSLPPYWQEEVNYIRDLNN